MYLPPKSYLYIYTINHIIIQLFKKKRTKNFGLVLYKKYNKTLFTHFETHLQ